MVKLNVNVFYLITFKVVVKKGLNIKEVEISPSTSVTSYCDENSTQATRNKAAKSKNLTSILVGLAQKPEGMAIGRTVRTFYRSR